MAPHSCTSSLIFAMDLPKHPHTDEANGATAPWFSWEKKKKKKAFKNASQVSIPSFLGSVFSRERWSHRMPGLGVAEHPQCRLEKPNCFSQMAKHFLQRMFLATRLILILKTRDTSKGNTCGYTLAFLERARAHEYQFINIQYKYCTISVQAVLTVHLIPALLPLQPRRRSLPSDLGLRDSPG